MPLCQNKILVHKLTVTVPKIAQMTNPHHRKVRSFVRRPGRITNAQHKALRDLLPLFSIPFQNHLINPEKIFSREAPRVLDIGFGDGEALLTLSINNPSVDYLGVEVHEPGIGHLLLLLERAKTSNVWIIRHDASEVLDHMLPDQLFSAVNLFFPDPWPKKRHHKRRLLGPEFIHQLARLLILRGTLQIATDCDDYARSILEFIEKEPLLENTAGARCYAERPKERVITRYEARGVHLGHHVRDLLAHRL